MKLTSIKVPRGFSFLPQNTRTFRKQTGGMIFKFNRPLFYRAFFSSLHFQTTVTELLRSCSSSNLLLLIHAKSLVLGLHSDLFINNLLIKCYSESSLLQHACRLFDQMPQKNIISWSSMISMFTHHAQPENALSFFLRFQKLSERANEFILASVMRSCCQSSDFASCAVQIHGFSIKIGLYLDVYVGTALINFYSRIECMEAAMLIFDELPVRNSVTWTSIMSGLCQSRQHALSLHVFDQMKEEEVEPDMYVISSLISNCAAMGCLEIGRQAHGCVYRKGVEMDVSINNVLVDLYCKCSKVGTAKKVFESISARNLVSWTTMIAGYMQNSYDADALALFIKMTRLGWNPDAFACTSVLGSCGSLMALKHGRQVHAYSMKANLWLDGYVNNALVDMYAKCDSLAQARVLFQAMNEQDVISYNAMIEGYAMHDEISEAFALFNRMRSSSLNPSLLTFVSLIGVSASLSMVDASKQIHCLTLKSGVTLELYAGSALVDVYSKCSYLDDARKVFNEMEERDLVVWNAMLFGYAQNGNGEEALKLFHQLCIAGIRPNEFSFVAVVAIASFFASIFHGLQFHSQITKAGFESNSHVLNALIDMYAKCGSIEDSRTLFEASNEKDTTCWNSMISRFAQHGNSKEALRIFNLMVDKKVVPNYITFVGVLTACCRSGLVEEGLSHFCAMKEDYGIKPGMEHYASVVNLLGCAGRLLEAKEFIELMPIKAAAAVWRSLLSACRVYGDVELGRYAARKAISLDSNSSGSHVLMSNILASKGRWDEAERVRGMMSQIGTVKEPGYSWIEIKKKVHVFIAKGREHKEAEEIYSTLDCMTLMLKAYGYVRSTSPCEY